jgi:hypothetical protein
VGLVVKKCAGLLGVSSILCNVALGELSLSVLDGFLFAHLVEELDFLAIIKNDLSCHSDVSAIAGVKFVVLDFHCGVWCVDCES